MGAIQNTINQALGTVAGASTVVGIGKAVGETKAKEEGNKALAEAGKEINDMINDDIPEDIAIEQVTEKNPYAGIAKEAINSMREGLPEAVAHQKAVKAATNLYYKQHNTSAIRLGYQSIINRIVGKGE